MFLGGIKNQFIYVKLIIFAIMKKEKQELALRILGNGRYRVDGVRGILQSFRVGRGEWVDCVPTTLLSGYKQHIIYLGRGKKEKVVVYLHLLVYLSENGIYEEGLVVDHEDSNPGNCAISNLRLTTVNGDLEFSIKNRPKTHNDWRVIRHEEIRQIRELMKVGASQSAIAKALDLNRLSVRHIYNKINKGEPLKFEVPGPYKSNNAKGRVVARAVVLNVPNLI